MACLFGLAPDGVYPATGVATGAVSSYLAISTLPDPLARPSAVYFLWHFPSPRGVRSLTGILLCGARTFLSALARAATVWPASRRSLTRWQPGPRTHRFFWLGAVGAVSMTTGRKRR